MLMVVIKNMNDSKIYERLIKYVKDYKIIIEKRQVSFALIVFPLCVYDSLNLSSKQSYTFFPFLSSNFESPFLFRYDLDRCS